MATVWFVRRQGGLWVAPGGAPAYELPLAELIFPLDLGTHRGVDQGPTPEPQLPAEQPEALHKVLVEVEPRDLSGLEYSGYAAGFYASPYPPSDAVRRLAARRPQRASA